MNDAYMIDGSMGVRDGLFCFCPVEVNDFGEVTSIITGMNLLGSVPDGSKILGVFHEDGNEASDLFYEKYKAEITETIKAAHQGETQ